MAWSGMKGAFKRAIENSQVLIGSLLLILLAVLFQNCGGVFTEKKTTNTEASVNGGGSSTEVAEPVEPGVSGPLQKVGAAAGVNSFEAIYANMIVITGIGHVPRCDREFENQKSALPTGHEVVALNSAAQSAVLKMAACVADEAIRKNVNEARSRLFPDFDFQQNSGDVDSQEIELIVDRLVDVVWGSETLAPTPVKVELKKLAEDLIRLDDGSQGATRRMVFGLTVTALGSVGTVLM